MESLQHIAFPIGDAEVYAYTIPTEEPESDGTLEWDRTTLIIVSVKSAEHTGIGYTYANPATAFMIRHQLFPVIENQNVLDNTLLRDKMIHAIRNLGRPGISSMAIAAVDNALWDLKARVLKLPLCTLLGQKHESIRVYASGGFTSYEPGELSDKFSSLKQEGHTLFKMKIGRDKKADLKRLEAARNSIGDASLFVDANGAYSPKEALAFAQEMKQFDVQWFEEPVTSDNLDGMRFVKEHVPAKIRVAAGEYGYSLTYFNRMLSAKSVDVLQADATRCAGITGFMEANTLCEAFHLPLSAHCAPSLHLHVGLACTQLVHTEYFRDHVRIEQMLFDGAAIAENGRIKPDLSRSGMGFEFKFKDAEKFKTAI